MPLVTLAVFIAIQQGSSRTQIHQAPALVPQLTLGRPIQIGNIAVVPIDSDIPLAKEKYLTLAEASKLGVIEIVEVPDQDNFTMLQIRNRSDLPILLFAGELLLGGKQDRIVAKDSIIPPHDRADIQVFCVEHGRWDGTPKFHYGNTIVPEGIRSVAVNQQNQSLVWSRVASSNAKAAAAPSTGTLRGTLDSPQIQAGSNRLFGEISSRFHPGPHTIGVICWIDGKIESADIYANTKIFNASRDELFRSYAVDAQLAGSRKPSPVDMNACLKFLTHVTTARRSGQDTGRFQVSDGLVNGVEFGAGRFQGGFGGGANAPSGGAAGFSHGTYRPNNGGQNH